jgi:hypothetical protein
MPEIAREDAVPRLPQILSSEPPMELLLTALTLLATVYALLPRDRRLDLSLKIRLAFAGSALSQEGAKIFPQAWQKISDGFRLDRTFRRVLLG